MQTPNTTPPKFQWDVTLIVIASSFVLLRLARIVLMWLTPPGPQYAYATFWIAYPILAVILGWITRELNYKYWQILLMAAIGFGAGLYYWVGPRSFNTLIYLPLYLAFCLLGFYLPVWIARLRKTSSK